jgi:RNA polymerase-binding transcription factor DksA
VDDVEISEGKAEILKNATIHNRVQYGNWNGKLRECTICSDAIPLGRLKAVNATTCIECAKIAQ